MILEYVQCVMLLGLKGQVKVIGLSLFCILDSGGSRGGAVGVISPVGRSAKIDFFINFHQNILLIRFFPAFTDSFSIDLTNMQVYFHKMLPVSWQNWQLYDPSTGAACTPYRNTSWFLPLRPWKRRKKHRRFVTVFLMWSETVSVINLQTLKSMLKVHKNLPILFLKFTNFLGRDMTPPRPHSLCVPSILPLQPIPRDPPLVCCDTRTAIHRYLVGGVGVGSNSMSAF